MSAEPRVTLVIVDQHVNLPGGCTFVIWPCGEASSVLVKQVLHDRFMRSLVAVSVYAKYLGVRCVELYGRVENCECPDLSGFVLGVDVQ